VTTLPRNLLRTALAALAVSGLLLAACGGDDSGKKDEAKTSTTKKDDAKADTPEEDIDVCGLLKVDDLSDRTGEEFTKADRTDSDTCQYTTAEGTAIIQLAVKVLTDEDGTPESFIADGVQACDEGTVEEDVELEGSDASFACLVSGAPSVAAVADGTVYLLQGLTMDESVSADQILTALAQLLPNAYS
jgi:hypothetical protein